MRKYWPILFLFITKSYGLVPMESLVLGKLNPNEIQKPNDPLNYILLNRGLNLSSNENDKKSLGIYRGFYQEGEELENFCRRGGNYIQFPTPWQESQATRFLTSTFQYVSLDFVIRALASYAKYFEFSDQEMENFSESLSTNYCSQNISVISIKEIKNNLLNEFKNGNFQLPTIEGNGLFPSELLRRISIREESYREKEFGYTVQIFRALCSWGGQVDDFRLLVPLLRNRALAAFAIRQLTQESINFDVKNNKPILVKNPETTQVACENFICRKTDYKRFLQVFPRGIGTNSVKEDLQRVYCSNLRDLDYKLSKQIEPFKSWIEKMSIDDDHLLVGQMISLISGMPEFNFRAESFKDLQKIYRASFDDTWNEWAKISNRGFAVDITYEESLTLEKPRASISSKNEKGKGNMRVVYDVNLGEIDRTHEYLGKISLSFDIPLTYSYLTWLKDSWSNISVLDREKREFFTLQFAEVLKPHLRRFRKKMVEAPWGEDLSLPLAREILSKVAVSNFDNRDRTNNEILNIPLEFRYGAFALKYIKDQFYGSRQENMKYRTYRTRQTP